jgi:tRNA nucleotidyltransferase (CCA-adding enzyme)
VGAHWETFAHGSDIGVRGLGPTLQEAFEQAALALTAVVTDPARVRPSRAVEIACESADVELLLYRWLNALIARMAVDHMLFGRFAVEIEDGRLAALAEGEEVDARRHEPAVEVKGATFTELAVRREPDGGFSAQCVVDV